MRNLFRNTQGVTAIEYGLIAAAIALAIILAVHAMGGSVSSVFTSISSTI